MSKTVEEESNKEKPRYTGIRIGALCCPEIDSTWYKAVIQSSPEGFLLIKHPGGDIIDVNDALCNMLGYSRDELLSMKIKDIEVGFDESSETIRKRILDIEKAGKAFFETCHIRKDGKFIDVAVSLRCLDEGLSFCFNRDITEQKEIYRRLKESEEKYRLVAENVTDVIFTSTLDGFYTYISPSVEKLRGYTAEEAIAQRNEEKLTPESLEKGRKVFDEAMAAEQAGIRYKSTRSVEHEMFCKDGSTVWVEAKTDFIRDSDGKPIGIVGVCRDISERKKVEKALIKSEEKYRLLAENVTDLIYTHDMDFNMTYISPSVKQLRGFTVEEAIAQKPHEISTPESQAKGREVMQEALEADRKNKGKNSSIRATEFELLRKDGSTVWVEAKTDFIRDGEGKPVGVLGVCRDISGRKRAEKALVESEERYKALVETAGKAGEGIIVLQDINGIEAAIIFMSPQFIKKLGYRREDITGKSVRNFLPDKYKDTLRKVYITRQKGEDISSKYETEIICKNRRILPVEVAVSTTIYNDKIATVVYVRDITKRKNTEKKLKSLALNEKRLRRQLEEQVKQRIEFTRALMHEMKTPLTPLISASDFAVSQIDEEPLKSFMKQINRSALNLDSRVDEFLDITRGEVGLLKIEPKKNNIKELLYECYNSFKSVSSDKSICLLLDMPDDLPLVFADNKRVQQVIYNLLDNSIKYTQPGGQIKLAASVRGGKIVIEVQDNGSGICKKDQDFLFQPYKRLHRRKGQHGGLGLGLAICKTLIELHKESIWFTSEPRSGSTFGFTLAIYSNNRSS